jgi:hypothetical protein
VSLSCDEQDERVVQVRASEPPHFLALTTSQGLISSDTSRLQLKLVDYGIAETIPASDQPTVAALTRPNFI